MFSQPTPNSAKRNSVATRTYTRKVILLGDSGAGKSCLMTRIVNNSFDESQRSTVGIDFSCRAIQCDSNIKMTIQFWDTAGEERFQSISNQYYRGAHAAIMVVDLTKPDALKHLHFWLDQIKENDQDNIKNIYLVGNKCDLNNECVITMEALNDYVIKHDLTRCFTTSAKSANGVDTLFYAVVNDLFTQLATEILNTQTNKTVKITPRHEEDQEACCSGSSLRF